MFLAKLSGGPRDGEVVRLDALRKWIELPAKAGRNSIGCEVATYELKWIDGGSIGQRENVDVVYECLNYD